MGATGISKEAKTVEEQNAIRRQKKATQRRGNKKGRASDNSDLFAGIRQDRQNVRATRLNARGVRMLDLLELVMHSSAPTAHKQLEHSSSVYVDTYTSPSFSGGWKERHEHALEAALQDMPEGRMRKYAKSKLDQIENSTRYMTR